MNTCNWKNRLQPIQFGICFTEILHSVEDESWSFRKANRSFPAYLRWVCSQLGIPISHSNIPLNSWSSPEAVLHSMVPLFLILEQFKKTMDFKNININNWSQEAVCFSTDLLQKLTNDQNCTPWLWCCSGIRDYDELKETTKRNYVNFNSNFVTLGAYV